MTISNYKKTLQKPLRPRTVTFLIRNNQVLLGLKKRGFGQGKYLGIGGKVEDVKDRSSSQQELIAVIKNGAKREIQEEIGVTVSQADLLPFGVLNFYFPHVKDESWNQKVYVFIAKNWQGNPRPERDQDGLIEIEPKWFSLKQVPLNLMWDDAKYWLPIVLSGKKVKGDFIFNQNLTVVDYVL